MKVRILVPMDGTNVGEAVLPKLENLVLDYVPHTEAEVILLKVNSIVNYNVLTRDKRAQLPYTESDQKELDEKSQSYLENVAGKLRKKGFNVTTMVKTGTVAEEIVNAAHETKANLIAMSTHGRTGIVRWAIGSTSDQVMRLEGTIPVLAVHPSDGTEGSQVLTKHSLQNLVNHS
jgi:nucleotide-binding universal stress UspA family protein